MTTLKEVRAALKPIGYKVKTKRFSEWTSAIFHHIESGEDMNGNVFSPETYEKWKPLMEWKKANADNLVVVANNEKLVGLKYKN
jgi:hypothetical protein